MISTRERLIVALDVSSCADALKIVSSLGDSVQTYKVGMQLYTAKGPKIVRDLISAGKSVFLDLKYHDIPNTVAATVREAAHLGVSMMTVHASGGTKMLRAAAEAARNSNSPPKILAVTVLTSMDENDLHEIGVSGQPVDQVLKLAGIALAAGCDGIVSSAHEVRNLRTSFGQSFLAITPGVRPAGAAHGDQARVVTPAEAIAAGATHIVMGRPITAALRPEAAIQSVLRELEGAETVAGSKTT
ncbi:MAG: orotidine-5'-phosphate decarboxylase [Acidobacteria bacterium]|nr:MAG: orotidine-5'-phosphate decarboxylase [Acidobacteriota bacterium]